MDIMNKAAVFGTVKPHNIEADVKKSIFREKIVKNLSYILIAALFIAGSAAALCTDNPIKSIMDGYSYDVLVILIVMELFTGLIAETGIMQRLAVILAGWSGGRKRKCLILFSGMMFAISAFLNNITAVTMILPIVFVLLKTLEVDRRYVYTFFAAILALSNTGGAASPVGDFPAIVIMTSGITDFLGYFTHALPLFAVTSAVLIGFWAMRVRKEKKEDAFRVLAVRSLKSQYRNIKVRYDVLMPLLTVVGGMIAAWMTIDQETVPPEVIAVLGYVTALVICAVKKVKIRMTVDMKSVITIASFLFLAQAVSKTSCIDTLAEYLQNNIQDPKLLVMAIMVITSLVAGIFSAGPAAAAMMPVIVNICQGSLHAQSDWVAVAYAAAICAGSSLFMWSATAGFILSGRVNDAGIENESGRKISWGIKQYFTHGLINYLIQMGIALTVTAIVL